MTVKFCVFLGREKNMKILHSYIELLLINNIIDEYLMFDFSRNINDHQFIKYEYDRLNILFNNKIFLHNFDENKIKSNIKTNWNPFYKKISEESSDDDVIIKCDDDILFIDIFSLKYAIIDRINDKSSFLIHSNCINNGVCAYFQRNLFNKIKDKIDKYPKGGILGILFEQPEIAYVMHNQFCTDLLLNIENLNKYIIDDQYINSRISINFILINGSDAKYLNNVSYDDEYELSSLIPEQLFRPNKIKGNLITSHLSYTFQDRIMLARNDILNNYSQIRDKYIILKELDICATDILAKINNINIIPICHKDDNNDDVYNVKNWVKNNSFYIKNVETSKYMYIDYDTDELILSADNRTIFEINNSNNSNNKIEINLGIYYLTRYNYYCKFRNENIFLKYFNNKIEKEIIIDGSQLKFSKYNTYFEIGNNNNNKSCKWIFEKVNNDNEYINVRRFLKNRKFYYQNIETNEIYTNYYNGWGWEGILW
jgi:hypothetical protein